MILAGKNATADGSVLSAHNNDLNGNEASCLQRLSGQENVGLQIPHKCLALRIYSGFAQGDAIAVNEHQVCITGGVALEGDRNEKAKIADPLVKNGIAGGGRYEALRRSKTARHCVELIGQLYTQYGVSYTCGVGIADPNEAWYMESGGGYTWVAIRIPDDSYWLGANGYRIGEVADRGSKEVISSPKLLEFSEKSGLWNPGKGPFNFAEAFGGGRLNKPGQEFHDTHRVWNGIRHLSPSLKLDPNSKVFPMFLAPDEKITIQQLISILRDQYQETHYALYPPEGPGSVERPISVPNCVHTDVVQLRNLLPASIGAVLWAGLGSATTTVYIPYYFGIREIPDPYQTAGPEYNPESAFWAYKTLSTLVTPYYTKLINYVLPAWQEFECMELALQPSVEKVAIDLYQIDKALAENFLTVYSNGLSLKALNMANRIADKLRSEIAKSSYKWLPYDCSW